MTAVNKFMVIFLSGIMFFGGQVSAADSSKKDNDDKEYSGVYENYQLIPNRMAELCKITAEEVVQDPNKLVDCVNSLAIKRRSSDAETSREGLKELKEIQAEQIIKTIGLATAKGAAVAEYISKTSEKVAEGNKNAKTTNDVDSAAIQTNAVLTSVVDSLRQLYVEQLKLLAITNIENIEKSTLENIASTETLKEGQKQDAEKAGGTTNSDKNTGSGGQTAATSNTTVANSSVKTPAEQWFYRGEGICEACVEENGEFTKCSQLPCPEGRYSDRKDKNIFWQCDGEECERIDITESGL